MVGVASLLVAGASEIRLVVSGGVSSTQGISAQIVVLDRAATLFVCPHRRMTILINAVATMQATV